ncbi:hypothetical protein ACHRVK_03640 [Flavobacterium plurextorum]|uniref:hypothetical protein n=1 Tax=Flavobacterium plurextorum TaxID=1114867 RepID=UPI003757755E
MKKTIFILSLLLVLSCSTTKVADTTQRPLSEITKIEFLDDDTPIIYIKTDTLSGIIIEDNKMLNIKKGVKMELGKRYPLSLTRIDKNYRGGTTYYSIASSKGTEKIIWREKDGLPLVLYLANNVNGLYYTESKK